MKRIGILSTVGLAMAMAVMLAAVPALAKDKAPTTRTVMGHVQNNAEQPLADAVVYLTNTKTADIRTYIADPEGAYHFSGLALNIDYQLYAKLKDRKSDVKTLSQFDNRPQVLLNLKIDVQ